MIEEDLIRKFDITFFIFISKKIRKYEFNASH